MRPFIACEECARLLSLDGRTKCEAFPGGIPDAVLTGQHDHTKPIRGDKGLKFKPRRKPEP